MLLEAIFYSLLNLFFIFFSKVDLPFIPLENGKIDAINSKYIIYYEKQDFFDILILLETQKFNLQKAFKKLIIRLSKNLKEDFLEPPLRVYDNLNSKFIFKPSKIYFSKSEYFYAILFNTYSSKIFNAKKKSVFYDKFVYLEINSHELVKTMLNSLSKANIDYEIFMVYKDKQESVIIKTEILNEMLNKIKSTK